MVGAVSSFLPQLLNWPAAAIAAAVAIPALLLLYFLKLRRVPQPVGSTLLWKKAVQDLQVNSPFQRLRRNLLLLLQLLALLALLFALARPVSEGDLVAGRKSVILIDRSASMNAADGDDGTRLEEAKRRAKALIDTMRRGDQATVISFDDTASVVQPYSGDPALLRAAIDDIEPSDRPTRLRTAYTLADANLGVAGGANANERLRDDPNERPTVFLFSDGRVPAADAVDLSLRGELNYERIGSDDTANLGIVAASVSRNYERPTQAQIFARIGNFGPSVAEAGVRVSVARMPEEGEDLTSLTFEPAGAVPTRITAPPARWDDPEWQAVMEATDAAGLSDARALQADTPRRDSIDLTLELPRASVVRVELLDPDDYDNPIKDALAADNVAFIVVPPPEPLKAMLVTRGNYFLRLLFESLDLGEARVVAPDEYNALLDSGEANDYDVTFFDAYKPPSLPLAGTFVFSGELPPEDATNVRPVTNEGGVPLFFESNAVLDWERDHPMLRGLSLNRVWASEGQLVTLPIGAEMLIEGTRGPLLILERNGPRTHLIFTFDLDRSTWPRLKTFPIFGYQMFEFLAAGEDVRVRESVRPGSVVGVPQNLAERAELSEGERVAVVGPSGYAGADANRRDARVDESGGLTLGPFESVGVYRTEPPVPQFSHVAVSLLDPSESNLLPGYTDPGALSGTDAIRAATEQREGDEGEQIEWWWWLVAAAAAVLMVEWFLYTRRVVA